MWAILAMVTREPRTIDLLLIGAVMVGIAVGAVLLVKRFVRPHCPLCFRGTVSFDAIPRQEQEKILEYYALYEDRRPDTSDMIVCRSCGAVVGSLERESQVPHGGMSCQPCKVCGGHVVHMAEHLEARQMPAFQDANPHLVQSGILRFVEGFRPRLVGHDYLPDTPVRLFGCKSCYTVFVWAAPPGFDHHFFVPLRDTPAVGRLLEHIMAGVESQ